MKILILINEDFGEMVFGKNTTLSYILSAVDLGYDVYVHKISPSGELFNLKKSVSSIHLNLQNAKNFVDEYRLANANNKALHDVLMKDFCLEQKISLTRKEIFLNEIEFVVQRLEPMKAPFPPLGEVSINQYLQNFKDVLLSANKKIIFNFPVDAYQDKELPLVLDRNFINLATPTATTFYGDKELPQKLQKIGQKYSEIFGDAKQKIVLKPDNSAQSLGVFAIEIDNYGMNLEQLKRKRIADLMQTQLYRISIGNGSEDISKIVNILCFVQFCKTLDEKKINVISNKIIGEIAQNEIEDAVHSLYGKNILLQPFLEGVRLGDIRINLAKMSDGNFKVVGALFRRSIAHDEENFTTCLTAGASRAEPIEFCASEDEQKNLAQKITYILQCLNGDEAIKNKYAQVLEIGCDFLLVGNKKDVYFGEANHYCQALMPFSEKLEFNKKSLSFYEKISALAVKYDGGLGVTKEIILQQIKLAQL